MKGKFRDDVRQSKRGNGDVRVREGGELEIAGGQELHRQSPTV